MAKLDFLAITEHNTRASELGAGPRKDGGTIAELPELYTGPLPHAIIPTAERLSQNGKFIALYGQEYSTIVSGNHVSVFDVALVIPEDRVSSGRFDLLVSWLAQNHPASGPPHCSIQSSKPRGARREDGHG